MPTDRDVKMQNLSQWTKEEVFQIKLFFYVYLNTSYVLLHIFK